MATRSKSGLIRKAIGARKGRLQRLINESTTTITTARDVDSTDDNAVRQVFDDVETLTAKLSAAVDSLSQSGKEWQELIESLHDNELEAEEAQYDTFVGKDDNFIAVTDEAREQINLLQVALRRVQRTDAAGRLNENSVARDNRPSTVKLPKLTLLNFDGNSRGWNQFWSLFKINIDESPSLKAVEKLTYLLGLLKGPALATVDGLEISDDSYPIAVSILKERYGRSTQMMIGGLYSELKRLPVSTSHVIDLQRTYDSCERIFRQLKTEGETVDDNRSLIMDILSKYPCEILKELSRRNSVGLHSTVSELQAALHDFIEGSSNLHELLGDLQPFGHKSSTSRPDPKQYDHSMKSIEADRFPSTETSALSTVDKPQQPSRSSYGLLPGPCYFCNGNHLNMECKRYPSAVLRVKRLDDVGRCRRCMGSGHAIANCRANSQRVKCYRCNVMDHPTPLCPIKFPCATPPKSATNFIGENRQKFERKVNVKSNNGESVTGLCVEQQSLLSTAITTIRNPTTGQEHRVRILLDSGSHRTYITESVVQQLQLVCGTTEVLQVAVFGSNRSTSMTANQVDFEMKLRDGGVKLLTAHTTPLITSCSLSTGSLPDDTQRIIDSMAYAMADDFSGDGEQGPPDVLIGSDYFWEFITGSRIKTDDGIYLIPSSLGIILGGRYNDESTSRLDQQALVCLTERKRCVNIAAGLASISVETRTANACPDVDEFWSLERIGITDDPLTNDDNRAMESFNRTVYFENGRYVCWPWKSKTPALPKNFRLAHGRLSSLAKRLAVVDGSVRDEYNAVIQKQLHAGIIEEVPPHELKRSTNLIHYLPHHPVVRSDNNTTKVRVVYDASARCGKDSISLNECFYRGPVILPELCAILLRFRLQAVALVADIEKAFLQINLQPSERDVTRFLWFRNPNSPDANDFVVLRFVRVPFGVISSPFLLGAVVQHHLTAIGTPITDQIKENIYVDNVITGAADDNSAIRLYREAKQVFQDAGMNLREWTSNSSVFMDAVPTHDQTPGRSIKVLGIAWDNRADSIGLRCPKWAEYTKCTTKREILQAIASVYDPLGLFQPCLLRAKCFLRELWNLSVHWDDTVDDELQRKWRQLHHDITPIFSTELPRRIPWRTDNTPCLIAFSDASINAYAATIYLRSPTPLGWETNLILAKSRLTPRSTAKCDISLPRLELLGVAIAAKASEFVRRSICGQRQPVKTYLMTDSTCVLGWLRSEKQLPVFVNNRVKLIRSLSDAEFHHVRSEDNPADVATRGLRGEEISKDQLWWHGPPWLNHDRSVWPTGSTVDVLTNCDIRLIQDTIRQRPVFHSHVAAEGSMDVDFRYPLTMDPSRYSSFRKLLRVTAVCLKFIKSRVWNRLTTPFRETQPTLSEIFNRISVSPRVTATDIGESKRIWFVSMQRKHFSTLIRALRDRKPHQLIHQLNTEVGDDGLVRCYGRLRYADLPTTTLQPILLPKNDSVTALVIKEAHELSFHSGISHTLSHLRRNVWVPQGRNAVRKIITNCLLCKRQKGSPFALPKMPPLPRQRLSRSKPFHYTGLDYMGPVTVSFHDTTQKMWVCLFTCLAIRAVHLEAVTDCSSQSFVDCVTRFVSRRGCPEEIISDNAAQFRLAKVLLEKRWQNVLNDDDVVSYMANRGIKWTFTTELSPWQGGFYERLVGIVKSAFKTVVGRKLLRWDEFVTLLTEIEAIVNCRPLTYACNDIDSGFVLRPADFLTDLMTGMPEFRKDARPEGGDIGKQLTRYWKFKQRRLQQLWETWYDDYLLSLRERDCRSHKQGRSAIPMSPEIDDVVLVKSSDSPRGTWKLGRVTNVITSGDGAVRSVELVLSNKHIIRRSVCHLYPLEIPTNTARVAANDEEIDQTDGSNHDATQNDANDAMQGDANDVTPDETNDVVRDGVIATIPLIGDGLKQFGEYPDDDSDSVPFDGFTEEDVELAERAVGLVVDADVRRDIITLARNNIFGSLIEDGETYQ